MSWEHEVAWAAGFFDGEGHFAGHRRTRVYVRKTDQGVTNMRYFDVRTRIFQVDRQALDRFQHAVLGIGSISPRTDKRPGHSPAWEWGTTNFEDSQAVAATLWKYLGPVKREQIRAVLATHKSYWQTELTGWHNAPPRGRAGRRRKDGG